MKFFVVAVAGLLVSTEAAFTGFKYNWSTTARTGCGCTASDPTIPSGFTAAEINKCVEAADKANCGYSIGAKWVGDKENFQWNAIPFDNFNQQLFKLPDDLIVHGLNVPNAEISVLTDLKLNVPFPKSPNCDVTPGTYLSVQEPKAAVTPLEEGNPVAVTPPSPIDYSFLKKEANYILITGDTKCKFTASLVPTGVTVSNFDFTFSVDPSTSTEDPTTEDPTTEGSIGLVVAGFAAVIAAFALI